VSFSGQFIFAFSFEINIKQYPMDKQFQSYQSNSSNIFLTGVMLFANMDFSGFLDYTLKALIGGAAWLGFQALNDYRIKRKRGK
jgi:hypothetical protein